MKYHSTINQKKYMQALGFEQSQTELAATSSFHDLDEVMASSLALWKRPWWVRWVDKPTVEVDWDNMQPFDGRKMPHVSYAKYAGENVAKNLEKLRVTRTKEWILGNKPGYSLKDRALDIASRAGTAETHFLIPWHDASSPKDEWRQGAPSPAEMGVPRWEANPEENARLIRAALRQFGADEVGFVELDEHTRKLIYSHNAMDGKAQEFEDVHTAYETDKKLVIPNQARWVIVFSVQLSEELYKRRARGAPTALTASATGIAYARARNILERLQTFLHVLGYQGLMASWVNGLGIAPAFGVMAGLGELSRLGTLISPEHGPLQRIFKLVTDLPLAPTKPINCGIMRFCRTCKICAEACPSHALSLETEPSWEVVGPWNNAGHRAYFINAVKCGTWWRVSAASCTTCFAVCPFSRKDKSFIHKIVAPTVSATSSLNGFFTRMHTIFGYETPRDPESWWKLDLPPYGINTVKGTRLE